jgi:FeS assembly protein IscX
MGIKWIDTQVIAIQLAEQFPQVDPQYVNFLDLHQWICKLDDFDDDPQRGGERILEAIQMAWIEEVS